MFFGSKFLRTCEYYNIIIDFCIKTMLVYHYLNTAYLSIKQSIYDEY